MQATPSSSKPPAVSPLSDSPVQPDRLRSLWLTEALRLTEAQTGWLDDEHANRQARAAGGSFSTRLQVRAWALGLRDGWVQAQSRWLTSAGLAVALLAVVAVLSGAGLAWAALGTQAGPDGVVVNVYRAVVGLLGLNALMLLVWLVAMLATVRGSAQAAGQGLGLAGRLWIWLIGRFSREARMLQLGAAWQPVLVRHGLLRWLMGLLTHGFWLVTLVSALLCLLATMATRRYGFVWESTLLGGDTFVALTQALGWLPSHLGFPALGVQAIEASGQGVVGDPSVRQQWAWWLVGLVVTYGVLPRLLLGLLCAAGWRRGTKRLTLDTGLPGLEMLRSRLVPAAEAVGVHDAAPPRRADAQLDATRIVAGHGAILVAIELGTDHDWPPDLPEGIEGQVHDGGRLDTGGQRQRVLDQLTREPAERLLMACDPRRSPDRGTLRLMVTLAQLATQARVWLLPAPGGSQLDAARVGDWIEALDEARLLRVEGVALAWLERGPVSYTHLTLPTIYSV